jgi:hypothetical protein
MPIPSLAPNVCGLCGGTLFDLGAASRCEACGHQPGDLARDQAFDYLAVSALHVITHPAPSAELAILDAALAQRMAEAHRLAMAFMMEALRKLGRAA